MMLCEVSQNFHFSYFSLSNILKATANDEVSLENGSLTKSQKNFSSASSSSNNRSPVSAQRGSPVLPRRREVTEEEAERSDPLNGFKGLLPQCFYCVFTVLLIIMFFCQSFCD